MKFTKINMFVCSVLASAPPTLRDVGFGYPHHGTSPTPTAAAGLFPPPSPARREGGGQLFFFGEWANTQRVGKHISFAVSAPCVLLRQHCQGYSMLSIQFDKTKYRTTCIADIHVSVYMPSSLVSSFFLSSRDSPPRWCVFSTTLPIVTRAIYPFLGGHSPE